jgi:hypothetical protein
MRKVPRGCRTRIPARAEASQSANRQARFVVWWGERPSICRRKSVVSSAAHFSRKIQDEIAKYTVIGRHVGMWK